MVTVSRGECCGWRIETSPCGDGLEEGWVLENSAAPTRAVVVIVEVEMVVGFAKSKTRSGRRDWRNLNSA